MTIGIRLLMGAFWAFASVGVYADDIEYLPFRDGKIGQKSVLALHHVKGGGAPVLYIHGSSFPIDVSFNWTFRDKSSWSHYMADNGFDAWGLDFLGYGHSTKSDAEMAVKGFGRADYASEQILLAVDKISQIHGGAPVSIIAHSWGTVAAMQFVARHPKLIDKLILFGPVVMREEKKASPSNTIPEFSLITVKEQRDRFLGGVPKGHAPVLEEPDFVRWGKAYLNTDKESQYRTPAAVRVPSGPQKDLQESWTGTWLYNPKKIVCPVLIVRGEWDTVSTAVDTAVLYTKIGSHEKKGVTIPAATHLMHLETGRKRLWREVLFFLKGSEGVF